LQNIKSKTVKEEPGAVAIKIKTEEDWWTIRYSHFYFTSHLDIRLLAYILCTILYLSF
jgi:hypothetical protein